MNGGGHLQNMILPSMAYVHISWNTLLILYASLVSLLRFPICFFYGSFLLRYFPSSLCISFFFHFIFFLVSFTFSPFLFCLFPSSLSSFFRSLFTFFSRIFFFFTSVLPSLLLFFVPSVLTFFLPSLLPLPSPSFSLLSFILPFFLLSSFLPFFLYSSFPSFCYLYVPSLLSHAFLLSFLVS